jgi:putative ABC transport system permease protein
MFSRTYRYLMQGAWRQIRRYRLRSLLVISCAALGVAGAVTSVNYASGGREAVLEQIRRLGTSLVTVSALQSRAVAGRARTGGIVTTLVEEDYRALREEVAGLGRSSAQVSASLRLKAGFLSKVTTVLGVEPDYFPMKSWELAAGRGFDQDDLRRSARVALLGWTTARELYPDGPAVGERIFINRVPFEVAGVLRERGPSLDGTNEDEQVFVPLTTAMRRLLNQDHYSAILFEVAAPGRMEGAIADMTALLRTRHRISPYRPDDFQVQSQTELIRTQLDSADRLGFLVRWIGLSGLVVSGLGILAIAWIAVRDRTREIGTRRALGARAPHIFFQFAFEAMVLATLGAALGLAVGWAASRLIADQTGLPFVFDGGNAVLALAVACLLNLAFASWPALRAARMDPIQALRHE